MQDGMSLCRPEFEEELVALLSIYDSELHVVRKVDGGVSLELKMCPAPPAYIKASITLHLPAAVRNGFAFSIRRRLLVHHPSGPLVAESKSTMRLVRYSFHAFDHECARSHPTLGGSCELTNELQKRIDTTMLRQIEDGEPVCFRVFVDAQEWLEENNRCARLE